MKRVLKIRMRILGLRILHWHYTNKLTQVDIDMMFGYSDYMTYLLDYEYYYEKLEQIENSIDGLYDDLKREPECSE